MTEARSPGADASADAGSASAGLDFRSLFRAAPAGFVVLDGDGTVVEVNDAFSSWTGIPPDDVIGTPFLRLLSVGDRILYSTRTQPLLDLTGRVPATSAVVLGRDRIRLAATLSASRVGTDPVTTLVALVPRRERSFEEAQLIEAVQRAEESDVLRREAEDDLQHLAQHDPLTGLLNREGLVAALTAVATDARTKPRATTAFWVGLDHFRVVNESLSATAGDHILVTVAERLAQRAAPHGIAARVGGDEFVVVAIGADHGLDGSAIVGLVAEPVDVDDLEIVVSASVGVAGAELAADAAAAESLLRNAGTAMYEAKATGRNRWKPFTARTDDSPVDEIRLLGEIRTAIADDQLRLVYQPQLDLRTGRIHGVEALIRWQHPSRGVVAPDGFIDVAEKTGLITQLGSWVCRTAIAQAVSLNTVADAPLQMSVNISARQLGDRHFGDAISGLLESADLDPARLTVEITETGQVTDTAQTADNLRRLKTLGVRLSIDDFGTGHAGFAYLNEFAVDELKIDRSFIQRLDSSPDATAIVVSCIELAHALSVDVVAEGVETAAQLARLTELGCDIVQGYHYSYPLAAEALRPWVGSRTRRGGRPDARPTVSEP